MIQRTSLPATLKMATKAFHQLGDLSRTEPSYAVVNAEDDLSYYGNWLTGYGFIGVEFPKETTRDLTTDEQQWLDANEHRLRIGSLKQVLKQKEPIR